MVGQNILMPGYATGYLLYTFEVLMCYTRSASNPMDKGACNFIKSEIQTWLPCTIMSLIHNDIL